MTPSKDIARLIEIMAALRDPQTGCPWDQQQTFATIAPYTVEEAYEVAEASGRGALADLKDELGDLLLQVVYHARMAEERDAFAFGDVVEAITSKMIRRHPHVFGTEAERAAGATSGFWDRAKADEKKSAGRSESGSVLAGIPPALPALTRAIKLQNKAAKVGFDWPSLAPVFAKLHEELVELQDAIARNGVDPVGSDTALAASEPDSEITEEFGDLLFVVANVARHLKIDPEAALRAANEKFTRRFRYIEEKLAENGRSPAQSTLAEMDELWNEAKAGER
jgi:ATP diphosphatase